MLLFHQIKYTGTPRNLFDLYDYSYEYNTRQASSKALKPIGTPKLELTRMSYRWRASKVFNQIPASKSNIEDIKIFKSEARSWIIEYTPINTIIEFGIFILNLKFGGCMGSQISSMVR